MRYKIKPLIRRHPASVGIKTFSSKEEAFQSSPHQSSGREWRGRLFIRVTLTYWDVLQAYLDLHFSQAQPNAISCEMADYKLFHFLSFSRILTNFFFQPYLVNLQVL